MNCRRCVKAGRHTVCQVSHTTPAVLLDHFLQGRIFLLFAVGNQSSYLKTLAEGRGNNSSSLCRVILASKSTCVCHNLTFLDCQQDSEGVACICLYLFFSLTHICFIQVINEVQSHSLTSKKNQNLQSNFGD